MEVLLYPNDTLDQTVEEFDFENNDLNLEELKKEMWDLLKAKRGLALAANQVGLPHRFFIMLKSCTNQVSDMEMMAINPAILETRKGDVSMFETDLSYPGVTVEIIRPTEIRAQWTTVQGKVREEWLFGYAGRAFQQKLDQLNGISMRDHCIPAKWKEAVANAEAKKT